MQILVQTLLRGQFAAVWEVVIKLVAAKVFVDILIAAVRKLPLNIEKIKTVARVFHPAQCLCSSFYELVLGSEAEHDR